MIAGRWANCLAEQRVANHGEIDDSFRIVAREKIPSENLVRVRPIEQETLARHDQADAAILLAQFSGAPEECYRDLIVRGNFPLRVLGFHARTILMSQQR